MHEEIFDKSTFYETQKIWRQGNKCEKSASIRTNNSLRKCKQKIPLKHKYARDSCNNCFTL